MHVVKQLRLSTAKYTIVKRVFEMLTPYLVDNKGLLPKLL